jgi:hypothetical protein
MIQEGAQAKGYQTVVEHVLNSGAIVDVHLEKGTKRIAVEIAITSTPERESTHLRNAITAGYDQVFGLFADEQLLVRTATMLQESCPAVGAGTVRLLPLSHLMQVG